MIRHRYSPIQNYEVMLLLPLVLLPVVIAEQSKLKCPELCECDLELQQNDTLYTEAKTGKFGEHVLTLQNTIQVTCSGQLLLSLPNSIPSAFNVLIIKDALIRSIPKTAFRRMEHLREFRVEKCAQLVLIEKFAFKGLKKLRVIQFIECPQLVEIPKAAFSGISNEEGLRIVFQTTPIQRVHGGAFRHSANIRELSISGSDLALSRHAFASITQLDFLTVSGVSLIEPQLFSNSTRFHIVHFKDSNFEIPPRAFEDLAHVHQFLIQRCRLPVIAEDAFSGMTTIETVELFDNQIGKLSPRAFMGIENIGRLRIARNTIRTFDSPESILSSAVQTRVEENTLDCTCFLKWMPSHPDRRLVDVNYCGASAVYRSVRSYLKQHCERGNVQRSLNSVQQHAASNHDRLLNSTPSLLSSLLVVLPIYFYPRM